MEGREGGSAGLTAGRYDDERRLDATATTKGDETRRDETRRDEK
jgi:hypothetical protein